MCGCKKRMKAMENSTSPAVRAAAAAIKPAHNVAMKVMDRLGVGDPEPTSDEAGSVELA